ncbi:Gfo/Idh/MocA family protein [Anaerocolumna sp. MB42-C2]|uniref:Gfo/Idh/MocA family protein n=1 Tax=Anaerocolumna sp. MB42-C2 TaxID=3070997 RepID=UPI0027DF63E8|nr:Gfo/Idh/MocA family oxidoreductase [Anaerocolumna sp. MB42-C2]WMJ86094.1 Gfo/Idh/MocA family oxidoreductase [Anaerocolumna sp. MB42-C2]
MNIAVISYWHVHAEGYSKEVIEKAGSKITAVWDEETERGEKYAKQFNAKFYEDYDELLSDKSIEGVIITSPTSMHKELIIKAIQAGKKVFSEKVLGLTTADCLEIKEALVKNNMDITLSLVKKCDKEFLFAKQMVLSGDLGQVTYARMRNVHNGSIGNWLPEHFYSKELCGGGAMIDLGAHPMYLLNWLLGEPKTVQSTFTDVTGRGVEDNAVSLLEFDKGAIGVSETGFVSVYNPATLEISGTKGCLLIRDGAFYATEATGGKWVKAENMPESLPSPVVQWAKGEFNKDGVTFGIDDAIMLTRMMEAAYKSYQSGNKETV